jgi:hypothetical protein
MGATGFKPPAVSEYALPPRAQFFRFVVTATVLLSRLEEDMGDGYCRLCEDEDHIITITVERDFLLTLLFHLDQDVLANLQDSLRESIQANCDYCGGERSRQLLDLVLTAKVAPRSQRPRIVISIF